MIDEVLDGKVEIGFIGFKNSETRLSFEKIWQDEMVLTVPSAHPWNQRKSIDLADLRSEQFVSRERGSGTLDSFRHLITKGRRSAEDVINVAMELGSTAAVKEALISGFGISILSRVSVERELAEGLLVEIPIRHLKMIRDFYEVCYKGRPLSPVAQAFREFVKADNSLKHYGHERRRVM
jgi:DNA-binding transcriptional LysR family regulator